MGRSLRHRWIVGTAAGMALLASTVAYKTYAKTHSNGSGEKGRGIQHVLLISIDGMHAVDFINRLVYERLVRKWCLGRIVEIWGG